MRRDLATRQGTPKQTTLGGGTQCEALADKLPVAPKPAGEALAGKLPVAPVAGGRCGRRGFVLIMVMVVLTGLALLAFHLAARCRMRLAELSGTVRASQGKWLAYAAVQRSILELEADKNDWDALNESWAQLGSAPTDKWFTRNIEGLTKDLVPYCAVMDEHAKINVRPLAGVAQVAQLGEWGKHLEPLLADWTDADEERRPDGAESADCAADGYGAKNRPLEVLEELRFLKGMSPQAMLGEDANGNSVLDAREDDGAAQPPLDNQDGLLDPGPWSLLTCVGDGKININTAPLEVLATLSPLDRRDAAAIVAYRESRQRGTSQEPPFRTVQELSQIVAEQWKVDSLQSALCTSSKDFRVVAMVQDAEGRSVTRHEVLLVREQGECKVRMYSGW